MTETEVPTERPPLPPSRAKRPWVGVLLSLLVPGFGIIRAGRVGRGLLWFVVTVALITFATVLFVWQAVPNWLAFGVGAATLIALLAMLIDSYRPGGMNVAGWILFLVAFLTVAYFPKPWELVAHGMSYESGSMEPTLRGKSPEGADHFLVNRMCYALHGPKRGDIIVFRGTGINGLPSNQKFIKRVIGMPGEKVEIRNGHLYADGRLLTEKDGVPAATFTVPSEPTAAMVKAVFEVPSAKYFVIGDNPTHSKDSRDFGGVPIENIYGKVARIFWPFSRAGVPQ